MNYTFLFQVGFVRKHVAPSKPALSQLFLVFCKLVVLIVELVVLFIVELVVCKIIVKFFFSICAFVFRVNASLNLFNIVEGRCIVVNYAGDINGLAVFIKNANIKAESLAKFLLLARRQSLTIPDPQCLHLEKVFLASCTGLLGIPSLKKI